MAALRAAMCIFRGRCVLPRHSFPLPLIQASTDSETHSMIIALYRTGASGIINYYSMHDRQPLLTAPYALTVCWRRGDGREQEKIFGFESVAERDRKIREIFLQKIRQGYSLLYSYIRSQERAQPDLSSLESPDCIHSTGG